MFETDIGDDKIAKPKVKRMTLTTGVKLISIYSSRLRVHNQSKSRVLDVQMKEYDIDL